MDSSVPLPPPPVIGDGEHLAYMSLMYFLNATEFVPVPGQGGQSPREILSAHAPLCSLAPLFHFLRARGLVVSQQ